MTTTEDFGEKRLGDFRILRELGRGGMGAVYLAEQVSLRRAVALKVLHPGISIKHSIIRRFQREAEAAGRLNHPNIVQIFSFGEEVGTHYFAMEYVDGETLDQMIRRLRKSDNAVGAAGQSKEVSLYEFVNEEGAVCAQAEESYGEQEYITEATEEPTRIDTEKYIHAAARSMAQIAGALDYAHRHGIVHRDVKPHNILLDRTGRPFLVDFGLALSDGSMNITKTGEVFGTPTYMSPEQVAGSLAKVDHRTDIYSLGTSFYELVTLQKPFAGQSPQEVVRKILTADPKDPVKYNRAVSRDFSTILLKCMEKDPEKRYQSAAELHADLERFLTGQAIVARPIGAIEKTYRYVARRRTSAAAVAVFVVLLIFLAYLGTKTRSTSKESAIANAQLDASNARAKFIVGDYQTAERFVLQGLEKDSKNGDLHFIRGKILRGRGDFEDALGALSTAAELLPNEMEPFIEIGDIYRERQEYQRAVDTYNQALNIDQSSLTAASVYENLAVCFKAMGKRAEERSQYERADQLRRNHAMPLIEAGNQFLLANELKKAERQFHEAIDYHPELADGYRGLGVIHLKRQEYPQALENFSNALQKNPQDPEVAFYQGLIHRLLADLEKAKLALQRAANLAGNANQKIWASKAHYHLAAMAVEEDAWEPALQEIEFSLQADAQNNSAKIVHAVVLGQLEKTAAAQQEFASIADVGGELGVYGYLGQAFLFELEEKNTQAHEILRAAELIYRNDARIIFHRARLDLVLGQANASTQQALDRVITLQPDYAPGYLLRFILFQQSAAAGIDDFYAALDLDPEFTVHNFLRVYQNDFHFLVSLPSLVFDLLSKELATDTKTSVNEVELKELVRFLEPVWGSGKSTSRKQADMQEVRAAISSLTSTAARARESAENDLEDLGWLAIVGLREAVQDPDLQPFAGTLLERLEAKRQRAEYLQVLQWLQDNALGLDKIITLNAKALPAIFQILFAEDNSLKRKAVAALEKIGGQEVIGRLAAAVEHADASVRFYALRTYFRLRKAPDSAQLATLAKDTTASIRLAVLLLAQDKETAGQILPALLSDSMPLVRWTSARMIGLRNDRNMTQLLRSKIRKEADPFVIEEMYRALHDLGDPLGTMHSGFAEEYGISAAKRREINPDAVLGTLGLARGGKEDSLASANLSNRLFLSAGVLSQIHLLMHWGKVRDASQLEKILQMRDSSSSIHRAAAKWALARLGIDSAESFRQTLHEQNIEGALARALNFQAPAQPPEVEGFVQTLEHLQELKRYAEIEMAALRADNLFPQDPRWLSFCINALCDAQDWKKANSMIVQASQRFASQVSIAKDSVKFYLSAHPYRNGNNALELLDNMLLTNANSLSVAQWKDVEKILQEALQNDSAQFKLNAEMLSKLSERLKIVQNIIHSRQEEAAKS